MAVTASEHNAQVQQALGEGSAIALELARSSTVAGLTAGGEPGYSDLTNVILLERFTRWSLQNPLGFYAVFAFVLFCALWGLAGIFQLIGEVD